MSDKQARRDTLRDLEPRGRDGETDLPLAPQPEGYPEALRERGNWGCWRTECANDVDSVDCGQRLQYGTDECPNCGSRTAKVPRHPDDYRLSTADPDAWTTFTTALDAYQHGDFDGLGYCFDEDDPFVGIDVDNAFAAAGQLRPWAADLLERSDTYLAYSSSGSGFHLLVRGEKPGGRCRRGDLEMYQSDRYFALTGEHVAGTPAEPTDDEVLVKWAYTTHLEADGSGADATERKRARPDASTADTVADLSDAELLSRARNASNGEKFDRLWRGDTSGYDSHSEARQAFANQLAFWTGDEARMLRLFKKSDLYRDGDERTFTNYETPTALEGRTEFYDPSDGASGETLAESSDSDSENECDGETFTFAGPPEPIVADDNTVAIVAPSDDGSELEQHPLGTWCCENCGRTKHRPITLDRAKADPKGALSQPQSCDCDNPNYRHAEIPKAARDTAVRAPSLWGTAMPGGVDPNTTATLWDEVEAYIRKYWDAGAAGDDDGIYAGLTAYALSTWFREELRAVPHLMLLGRTTGGKTRLINTLGRLSYRAHVSAMATPAAMFRLIDAYRVSYFVSEYHNLDFETQRLVDGVVRAGQKRGELVDRAEQTGSGGYEPKTFDPFSHIVVATQFDVADDIRNRCVQTRSSSANGPMPEYHDDADAQSIRDTLLYVRFRYLKSDAWADAYDAATETFVEREIWGRTREKLRAIVTVGHLFDRMDALEPFIGYVVSQDAEDVADSDDAVFVEVVRDLALEEVGNVSILGDADPFAAVEIPYGDVGDAFEAKSGRDVSNSWVGQVRDRLGLEKKRKRDGTVIRDDDLGEKLRDLCEELNLAWERGDAHDPAPNLEEDEQGKAASGCADCGANRYLTHRNADHGGRICGDCAEELRRAAREERARHVAESESSDNDDESDESPEDHGFYDRRP